MYSFTFASSRRNHHSKLTNCVADITIYKLTLVDTSIGIRLMRQKVIRPRRLFDGLDDLIQAVLWRDGKVVANVCQGDNKMTMVMNEDQALCELQT